jgi:hypothetical protein
MPPGFAGARRVRLIVVPRYFEDLIGCLGELTQSANGERRRP